MANLLVTGGAGFIGANFVYHWLNAHPGDTIIVLDALTYAGNIRNLDGIIDQPNCVFVKGDIGNLPLVENLLSVHYIDRIVHFAAEAQVDRSRDMPDTFLQTNVIGTHTLLQAARKVWGTRDDVLFHHVSTDEVFGSLGEDDPAFTETSSYAPTSPFAVSKAAADMMVRACHQTYGLPVIITHSSSSYGPYQHPQKLIPLIITNALDGQLLPIYGDGMNSRDWLHVEDHCRGIALAMENGVVGESYALGGNSEWTNIDIVSRLCDLIDFAFADNPHLADQFPRCPAAQGRECAELITHIADRAGNARRRALDCTRATEELGYHPQETVESGIRKLLDWYLVNEAWWRPLKDTIQVGANKQRTAA